MRVLGIDPGTATCGYGVVEGTDAPRWCVHGVVRTAADAPMASRLLQIFDELSAVVAAYRPDVVAVEQLFHARNTTTSIVVGQARGVALLVAAKANLPVVEYKPAQVKQAVVGYGSADKAQVQAMVRLVLGLAEVPRPDDAADALAVAICHAHSARFLAALRQ